MPHATLLARTLAGALLLALPTAVLAQTPPWQLALSGNNNQPGTGGTSQALATAINGAGDVFVTGSFSGTVAFGTTRLTSLGAAGTTDVFVAKWSAAAQAFTWATSGGGTGNDTGRGIAVRGPAVYVTGDFASASGATFAGQALAGAGGPDVFVAKYYDTSTGSTPATNSFANGWATSGGGTGADAGYGVAVSSAGVFVAGSFTSGASASIAGKSLAGAGGLDAFVAKYADTSTGTTPATSSYANAWVGSGGGSGADVGYAVAVRGTGVFVTGAFTSGAASFAGQALTGAGGQDVFVAKYNDTSSGTTPATSSFGDAWAVSGGSTGPDAGYGIAVSGPAVYVTGSFTSGAATFSGPALTGAGGVDAFVVRYNDTSTGSTPATSSVDAGWAASGGGPGTDTGLAVAVSGTAVFITGSFSTGTGVTVAGQALTGAGGQDAFAARYNDLSTGTTAATSGYANAWAVSGGGTASDAGTGVAVGGAAVYVAGQVGAADASFGVAPAKVYAPASSALFGTLNLTTGAWQQADGPLQGGTSTTNAVAADASGNVYVTGNFSGSVGFGSTRLVSAGGTDVFVAKWDATSLAYTWATSGGGTGNDAGNAVAVSGTSVYVAGSYSSATATNIAGRALTGAGGTDVFVAKYYDTSTGSTPAASSYANGWVASAGGLNNDVGYGVAVRNTGVFVTGLHGGAASVAGQTLAGAGSQDMFVAKYVDTSTGTTPGTSTFVNGWAASGGGTGNDQGAAVAVRNTGVFVTGFFTAGRSAVVAGQALPGVGTTSDMFVAKYVDTSTGNTTATSSFVNGWATSGGGTGLEAGTALAVSGTGVYVTGYFQSGASAVIAGQALAGAGSYDAFVAKYNDTSTGNTTATSSYANGWAASGGGTGEDFGQGVAVSGTGVYVTGSLTSNASASIAGQALAGAGSRDVFLAKYLDTSTGSTPATSSFANGWAASGGGPGADEGLAVAVSGQQVYAVGTIVPPAAFGSVALSNAASGQINLLARLTDATLTPLATATPARAGGLALYPNPVSHGAATLIGAGAGAAVQVLDALGRLVLTATADGAGTAPLALPAGLAPGVYVVRAGTGAARLVVE